MPFNSDSDGDTKATEENRIKSFGDQNTVVSNMNEIYGYRKRKFNASFSFHMFI